MQSSGYLSNNHEIRYKSKIFFGFLILPDFLVIGWILSGDMLSPSTEIAVWWFITLVAFLTTRQSCIFGSDIFAWFSISGFVLIIGCIKLGYCSSVSRSKTTRHSFNFGMLSFEFLRCSWCPLLFIIFLTSCARITSNFSSR